MIIITVFNKKVILDEIVIEQSGYPANIVIFTMVLKFIMQAYSCMKMPWYYTRVAILVIMGNYVVSHNHQPADNDQRGFDVNPFPQIFKFSAKVITF